MNGFRHRPPRGGLRRMGVASLVAALMAIGHSAATPAAAEVSVGGDDQAKTIVGEGGILLDGSYDGARSDRREVADCPGCRWRLEPACAWVGGQPLCGAELKPCPVGTERFRVWHRPGPRGWQRLGTVCVGGRGPTPTTSLSDQARDAFSRRLPPLAPGFQPSPWALTGLPVVFTSGHDSRDIRFRERLLGFRVAVQANATYRWTFARGVVSNTAATGSVWPDRAISHTFVRPGNQSVSVQARWAGTFTFDGVGPIPIDGTVGQSASVRVPVREARAVLVR